MDLFELVLQILSLILYHNVFTFNDSHFLHVQRVAMGTCAQSYVNLYLGEWEHTFLLSDESSNFSRHILAWLRCIDDIFLIWDGPIDKLHDCLQFLNLNSWFLDVEVEIDANGLLSSNLFLEKRQLKAKCNRVLMGSSFHLSHYFYPLFTISVTLSQL